MPGTRKLGKTTDQRMAMLRQQVTDFLDTGRMETTYTRAKEIGAMAEKMITLGKKKDIYRQVVYYKCKRKEPLIEIKDYMEKRLNEISVKKEQIQFDFNPMNSF